MRLIDADELIRKIRHDDKNGIYWEIYHAPTIEAEPAEVVTCKECKNRYTQWCGFYYKYEGKDGIEDYEWTYDDGYCSFGEWKIPEEIDEVVGK